MSTSNRQSLHCYKVSKWAKALFRKWNSKKKLREIKKESELIFIFNEESFIIIFITEANKYDENIKNIDWNLRLNVGLYS